jgi:hypothetical protein
LRFDEEGEMEAVKRHIEEGLEALEEVRLSFTLAIAANWDGLTEGILLDAQLQADEARDAARDALARAEQIMNSAR